jgi:beta-mannanase
MDYRIEYYHSLSSYTAFADWSTNLGTFISNEKMSSWVNAGITPMITWQPRGVNYADITSGKYDAYITSSAQALKAFGSTVFVRPFHEFNQKGNTYSLYQQGASAAADSNFIAAWRYVVNKVRSAGANNVKWVWCYANHSIPDDTKNPWNNPMKAYPGDQYVDWVAFDAFNRDSQQFVPVATFDQLIGTSYSRAVAVPASGSDVGGSPTVRPVMIAEIGIDEMDSTGDKKAAFITQMFNEIPVNYTHLRAINYFDFSTSNFNYKLHSSDAALKAWVDGIRTYNSQNVLNYRGYGVPLNRLASWQ